MKNKELKKCKKCGCNMSALQRNLCDYCNEKRKKPIDTKWLVRGHISANSNACAMFGDSL